MQEKMIRHVLVVSGIVTVLGGLQFFAPSLVLSLTGIPVTEPAGLFYAQHWALLVLVMGALLLYAVPNVALRRPILLAVGAEKLGLVGMVLTQWSEPALQGMHMAAVFDAVCVLLYGLYLLRRTPA